MCYLAQFIVSKNNVINHPKQFYENFYNWLVNNELPTTDPGYNPGYDKYHTGRYAEWSWRFIFSSDK